MATLDRLTGRLQTIQNKILFWEASESPDAERRLKRLNRRLDRVQSRIGELSVQMNLPQDSFEISFKQSDDQFGFDRIEFTIFDSPFDDTFTGGEPLLMQFQGTETKQIRHKFSRRTYTSRSTLANGQYWQGLSEQTVFAGGSFLNDIASFDEVTVTLAVDSGNGVRDWRNADVLATQLIDVTDLNA
tara:strand:+ start:352 stop:912 length:561 start_codon:yes stop_codon:yes gene_type:complete